MLSFLAFISYHQVDYSPGFFLLPGSRNRSSSFHSISQPNQMADVMGLLRPPERKIALLSRLHPSAVFPPAEEDHFSCQKTAETNRISPMKRMIIRRIH